MSIMLMGSVLMGSAQHLFTVYGYAGCRQIRTFLH